MSVATNVGAKFSLVFKILFFMTLVEVCISLFAYSISVNTSKKHAEPVFKLAVFFYAIASLVEVIMWIYLFVIRF